MTTKPPRLARWLLVLIPASHREFIEGDLEEEYAARLPLGQTRADAWYWHQVLATLPPIGVEAALKRLRKAATTTNLQGRHPSMASQPAGPASSATPRRPAFGSLLLASRPTRDRNRVITALISVFLHGGIFGGIVYSTMGHAHETSWDEVQMIEDFHDLAAAPPPPPPPVEAAAPVRSAPIRLTPPDVIPPEIPPPGERITAEELYRSILEEVGRDTTDEASEEVVPPGTTPSFTPFTVAPAVQNLDEVARALEREYPPLLRDAGVGGRVEVWIRLDDRGRVEDTQVNVSSGHPALDEAALRVARIIDFSPAMNRDKAVSVWVSIPITFQVR